jgi:hypothetical protein
MVEAVDIDWLRSRELAASVYDVYLLSVPTKKDCPFHGSTAPTHYSYHVVTMQRCIAS